ncbi:Mannitol dehydrogenase [Capsicum baccatum]|uniref:Mannitol dehydrogenase n=1 Tax=Capsicum baccatum TaxID=33114 RepID=A0A2G2VD76_CAPBA|nr:Mannitol dehydrogenase [Capsicum baccatum]
MKENGLKKLSELHSLQESELKFIIQPWEQIVECRRVLKWTYAYGFYLPEKEKAKKQFFEYLQGQAEADLERLHECAEKEFLDHLGFNKKLDYTEQGSYKNFVLFRIKLVGLTEVTGNYFDKITHSLFDLIEACLTIDDQVILAATSTLDGIIDTVSAEHPILPLFNILKPHGKLIMVGASAKPLELPVFPLLMGRKIMGGSIIGGMKETQEMLDFAAKHNITPEVEVISMDYVNTAMERLSKSDVKYRFVLDVGKTLKAN